jgi:hypothetical protein
MTLKVNLERPGSNPEDVISVSPTSLFFSTVRQARVA